MPGPIRDWLEARTGYRAILGHLLYEPIPGGPSLAYVFGSLLLITLCNQLLTGALLMAFYAPSASDAWASVAYLQDQVRLGWFLRGMHSSGASLMVAGLVAHLVQVALFGAYRAPREMNWWTGILLSLIILGFALTGYLLPWDQKGYWATQVATTLLGAMPLVGHGLQLVVQGGPSYGNLTLTHFYALHVFVLPALLVVMVVVHVALFRRHGVTPRWGRSDEELEKKTGTFFPRQAGYDLVAGMVALGGLALSVVRTHGVELSAPADPSEPFDARPEWYFLPLYQLLKYFPGQLEVAGALGAPLLFIGALAILPWLDRANDTHPSRRLAPLSVCAICLFAAAFLGVQAQRQDARNPRYQEHETQAKEQASRARKLALEGVPLAGGVAVYENDPLEAGRKLFGEHCAQCHRLGRLGPPEAETKGPNLTGAWSRPWLTAFLQAPGSPRFFGHTEFKDGMKAVQAAPPELADLVEYVYALGQPPNIPGAYDAQKAKRGALLFEDKNCDLCHERDGKTSGQGPNLNGYGSAAWIRRVLESPGAAILYGEKNDMPAFGKKLSAGDLDRLTLFLSAERLR
jgi:ubiquinol-cytochrome c reductase cytochrome b subunit